MGASNGSWRPSELCDSTAINNSNLISVTIPKLSGQVKDKRMIAVALTSIE